MYLYDDDDEETITTTTKKLSMNLREVSKKIKPYHRDHKIYEIFV